MNLYPVYLPRLKNLCLNCIVYEEDESLPRLLSGCPVLEELEIMDMSLVCCNVSSPSVKRLRLFLEFSGFVSLEYSDGYRVELNTPALEELVLEDGSYEHIQSGPLPCLIKADITFTNYRYCASILKFVNRLSNIEYLKLYLAHYGEV